MTFSSVCLNTNNKYVTSVTQVTYTPPATNNGSMAYATTVGPQRQTSSDEWCTNVTITAQSPAGSSVAVDLYLDEVLHAVWAYEQVA